MKSAERSTKWCHSNDEETGDNAVQHLSMLSNTAEQKAYVTPHGLKPILMLFLLTVTLNVRPQISKLKLAQHLMHGHAGDSASPAR